MRWKVIGGVLGLAVFAGVAAVTAPTPNPGAGPCAHHAQTVEGWDHVPHVAYCPPASPT